MRTTQWLIPAVVLAAAALIAVVASVRSPVSTDATHTAQRVPTPTTPDRIVDRESALQGDASSTSGTGPKNEQMDRESAGELDTFLDGVLSHERTPSDMVIADDDPHRADANQAAQPGVGLPDALPPAGDDQSRPGALIRGTIGDAADAAASEHRRPRRSQSTGNLGVGERSSAPAPIMGGSLTGPPRAAASGALAARWSGNDLLPSACGCSQEPYPFPFRRSRPTAEADAPRPLEDQVISTVGPQRVAVLIAWSEATERPSRSHRDLKWEIFDERNPRSFASYWREVSGEAMSITGDIHRPYFVEGARYSFDYVKGVIEQAELARDVNWSAVDRLYVLVPPSKTGDVRHRPIAAFGDSWRPAVELPDGRLVTAAITILDDRSMGVEEPGSDGTFSGAGRHEFGHTLGWRHQGQLECGDAAYPEPHAELEQDEDECVIGVGGIILGGISMGNGRTPTAREQQMLGWMPDEDIERITSSGVYEIELQALSATQQGVRAIHVPRDRDGHEYVLELRRPVGTFEPDLWAHPWSPLRGPIVDLDGVFFSIEGEFVPGHGVLSSTVLDVTPGMGPARPNAVDPAPTPTDSDPLDWMQSCLRPGESFICPVFGTRFTVVQLTDEAAIVRIEAPNLPVIDEESRDFDSDGDGTLTWADYLSLLADPTASETELEQILQLLDNAGESPDG